MIETCQHLGCGCGFSAGAGAVRGCGCGYGAGLFFSALRGLIFFTEKSIFWKFIRKYGENKGLEHGRPKIVTDSNY